MIDIDITLKPPGGELKPKDLTGIDPVGRENVYEEEIDRHTHLSVQLHQAQFGQCSGEPAALLVFRFVFQFRSGGKRIKSVNIDARFCQEGEAGAAPYVVRLAPVELKGEIFEEHYQHGVSGGVQVGGRLAGADFRVNASSAYLRQNAMSLTGSKRSSDSGVFDRIVWDCKETRSRSRGIIPRYLGAVIVKCPGRFSAVFDVQVTQASWVSNMWRDIENLVGRGEACPVVFDPEKPVGDQIPGIADFKELDLEDIITMDPKNHGPPIDRARTPVQSQTANSTGYIDRSMSLATPSNLPAAPYYDRVNVLLLYWEDDDLGCLKEVKKLQDTFERIFRYRTKLFMIPSQLSQAILQAELTNFVLNTASKSGLTIIYYAGHGDPDDESDKRLRKLIWAARERGGPTLKWSDVQPTLYGAEGDVLLLLDCCHAALAVRSLHDPTIEILAACALNIETGGVGRQSFTTALILELKRAGHSRPASGITVEGLHQWLSTDVAGLQESPYRVGTSKIYRGRSIVLRPLP